MNKRIEDDGYVPFRIIPSDTQLTSGFGVLIERSYSVVWFACHCYTSLWLQNLSISCILYQCLPTEQVTESGTFIKS